MLILFWSFKMERSFVEVLIMIYFNNVKLIGNWLKTLIYKNKASYHTI